MRLPQPLLESLCFTLAGPKELCFALGLSSGEAADHERAEIYRLVQAGLPPIVSRDALAAMIGVNHGFIWSLTNNPRRHYRHFTIPKGKGQRHIFAPRVGLKIIQKWLSVHLEKLYQPPSHVFGFVRERSHIQAAGLHTNAAWVLSLDIENFFPSTPVSVVSAALEGLGYSGGQASIVASLSCLNGGLAQGSPLSPLASNIAFGGVDLSLSELASQYGVRFTRYADDLTFSGIESVPAELKQDVLRAFARTPWRISERKTELQVSPRRLKVHGLLVHGDRVRLTKGYRNRIRAYRHLMAKERGVRGADQKRVAGHLRYADQVERE